MEDHFSQCKDVSHEVLQKDEKKVYVHMVNFIYATLHGNQVKMSLANLWPTFNFLFLNIFT